MYKNFSDKTIALQFTNIMKRNTKTFHTFSEVFVYTKTCLVNMRKGP